MPDHRMDDPPDDDTRTVAYTSGGSGSPERIGPYRVLERLGVGGMGEVFLAEQVRPIRRHVALKVIKLGMSTRDVIARFEGERQALAMMQHPGIARVYEAGATPDGQPYFAMEYVKGIRITQHCNRHRLDIRERLELFLQVCAGVQHAHQKGIVHRDLKPSNILVTIENDVAVPKIIDFGVAKTMGPQLTDRTIYTRHGELLGTPAYMSPEQAELRGENVDTRTDVYALGVILYELLVGERPFDPKEMRETAFDEVLRKIRQDDPPRPSRRLARLGDGAAVAAGNRSTDVRTLMRQLGADLDWIVMKAIRKVPEKRYGSASELAADVERFLTDKPVHATVPSFRYRLRKFVRRHRAAVAFSTLAILSLFVLAVTMTVQAGRIARERDRANEEADIAREVSGFLTGLFEVSDPLIAAGDRLSAREVLDQGARTIDSRLGDQPLLAARFRVVMAQAYDNLGLYDEAGELLESALESQRRLLPEDHPDTLLTSMNLGVVRYDEARYDEAEAILADTLKASRRVMGEDDVLTLNADSNLTAVFHATGRLSDAERGYLAGWEARKRILGEEHPDTLGLVNNLAALYREQGRYEEATELFEGLLDARRRVQGADHPYTLGAASNLANIYRVTGRHDEAEALFLDNLERRRRIFEEDHPDVLSTLGSLGQLYTVTGRMEEGERLLRQAYEGTEARLGPDHTETASAAWRLAGAYLAQRRIPEADELFTMALSVFVASLGEASERAQLTRHRLGTIRYLQHRFAEAERIFLDSVRLTGPEGRDDELFGIAWFNLACLAALQGRTEEALDRLIRAVEEGFDDEAIFTDPDLATVRDHPRFEEIAAVVRER